MSAAAKQIESTRNTYDDPDTPGLIPLSAGVYVQVLDPDDSRIGYTISNESGITLYVKEKAFDDPDDTTVVGETIWARTKHKNKAGEPPTGAVSVMPKSGSPSILVEEH